MKGAGISVGERESTIKGSLFAFRDNFASRANVYLKRLAAKAADQAGFQMSELEMGGGVAAGGQGPSSGGISTNKGN